MRIDSLCKLGLLLWMFFLPNIMCGQHRLFRVMTYNVENLFDTCHDVGYDDREFLPTAQRKWDSRRYWKKQGQLSRTIAAASGAMPIDIVGLCEVENDSVIRDLTQRTRLHRMGYQYVVTHSQDARGVDVALLYQPEHFKLLHHESVRIPVSSQYGRPTRDILYAVGRLPNGDSLDIFVNHWPSRRGGSRLADDYRFLVAKVLRDFADSLLSVRAHPCLILMGDFNDEYTNRSIKKGLGAFSPDASTTSDYVVLSAGLKGADGIAGTYKFRGIWNQLDQIIISRSLLDSESRLRTSPGKCRILSFPFLLEADESRGGVKPYRTYLGPVYQGGVSDHLPLILELEW